jgi:hypothetical protein
MDLISFLISFPVLFAFFVPGRCRVPSHWCHWLPDPLGLEQAMTLVEALLQS